MILGHVRIAVKKVFTKLIQLMQTSLRVLIKYQQTLFVVLQTYRGITSLSPDDYTFKFKKGDPHNIKNRPIAILSYLRLSYWSHWYVQ